MKDTTHYDDDTLVKAHAALMDSGLTPDQASDAITALLNAGILLRERSRESEVGITYLLELDGLNDTEATFAHPDGTSLTLPRPQWERLHRPGRIAVEVSA